MGLFLFRFWVALVPLAIYIVWFMLVRNRAIKNNQPLPQFRDTPLYWAILSSLAVAGICFMVLGIAQKRNSVDYTPPARITQEEKSTTAKQAESQKNLVQPPIPAQQPSADPSVDTQEEGVEADEWGSRGNNNSRYVPSGMDKDGNMIPAHIREKP